MKEPAGADLRCPFRNQERGSLMISIVFTACLLVPSYACREKEISFFDEQATHLQCVMTAHIEIAKWVNDHPQESVRRWRCEVGKPGKNI
jgi:hypothetical protein